MATPSKTQTAEVPSVLTDGGKWNGEDVLVLDGMDVLDKAELVDKPFVITGVKMTVSERDYALAWVEGEFVDAKDGEPFVFTDSSKNGVRFQLETVLTAYGKAGLIDEWIDLRIKAPKGLRVSEHEQPNNRGKTVPVKSYYITTAGKRTRA